MGKQRKAVNVSKKLPSALANVNPISTKKSATSSANRQRIIDHGEVFTPPGLVNDMLDLVAHECERVLTHGFSNLHAAMVIFWQKCYGGN